MRRFATVAAVVLLLAAGLGPAVALPAQDAAAPTSTSAPGAGQVDQGAPAVNQVSTANESTNETTVTIVSYNDIQTAVSQNGTTPRMVTLIERRRAAHDNPTVVVGGGDQVSPHSLAPISQWREPVAVLNELDPDAEVVGNHDLDFGFEAVENFSAASEFPWLMANVVRSDSGEPIPGTEPYTVVEKQGVKVGVVGIADEAIKGKTAVDFDEQGYEVRDHVSVADQYATMLKEERNVDVVVVAAHVGIPESREIAQGSDAVDVIVVGDDEMEYPPRETSGTVIMEAEARAEHVAEVNLTVSDGEVVDWDGAFWTVDESIPHDEETASIIENRREAGLSTVLGESEVALDSRFASNYHDETALGNMITDAFRWKADSEVAITNAGGIRSNEVYGPGEITAGDVYSMLPFGNTLVTVELTGAEIKQLLASQVVTLESETGQQYGAEPSLQVSGVTYEYVAHEGAEPYVRDARVNGEPLAADATYTVTVNSYMAGWDDSVLENATVVSRTNVLYGTVVAEYIKAQETVAPGATNRIRRVDREIGTESVDLDGEGTVEVSFELPDTAESVNESTVRATTAAGETVEPTDVAVSDGTMTVAFEDEALVGLSEYGGPVEIYAAYTDSAYNRSYFESSVLNAELETTVDTSTPTPTSTPTASPSPSPEPSTDSPEPPTDTATIEDSPGFGAVAGLLALLAVALIAARRD